MCGSLVHIHTAFCNASSTQGALEYMYTLLQIRNTWFCRNHTAAHRPAAAQKPLFLRWSHPANINCPLPKIHTI